MPILASDIISYARSVTDQEVGGQFTDASVLPVLNAIYQRVRRKLANRVPTVYTKQATFTATAAIQDVTGAPLSLTDFGSVRRIRRQVDATSNFWEAVGVANSPNPDIVPFDQTYVFLERGNFLEFFPSTQVVGQIFELQYLSQPVALTGTGSVLDVPEGFQEPLGEYLAAKFRARFEEEVRMHMEMGDKALDDLLWDMERRYGVQVSGSMQVSGTR